jgi:hypothetical protein
MPSATLEASEEERSQKKGVVVMKEDPKTKLPPSSIKQPISEELIRRRAFDLYEARGCEDGHDLDDWLEAETELARAA